MIESPENLTLVYLRGLDEKMDRLMGDATDLKQRMTSVERQLGDIRVDRAKRALRINRVDGNFDQIERRFDLVTAVSL